jgi:dsDNA-specific endonuclease/ATPase MutS2
MPTDLVPGDLVHTPFGKGSVREVRNNRRVLVEVRGRAMLFDQAEIEPVDEGQRARKPRADAAASDEPATQPRWKTERGPSEIDLHGLTVELALERAEAALNDAILADRAEIRFIHGQSSTRIRNALHRSLARISSVRAFRLDPRNPGVTIVQL